MTFETATSPVGFIGLGLLGQAMALRLAAKGMALVVWNREPERCTPLEAAGAVVARSPREVAERCELLCLCVIDGQAVRSVLLGSNDVEGLVAAPARKRILVDFSTVDPDDARLIAAQAEQAGFDYIDAPVSGGPAAAVAGTLTVMAGGKPAVFERVDPLLHLVARNVEHIGGVGAGQAMKVVNQALVGGTFVLLAETLALVRGLGLSADIVPRCLEGGLADSVALQRVWPKMVHEDFTPPTGRAAQLLKDLKNVDRIGRACGLELALIATATHQYAEYVAGGGGAEETLSITRLYERSR